MDGEFVPHSLPVSAGTPGRDDSLTEIFDAVCSDIDDIFSVDCKTESVTVLRSSGQALGLEDILNTPGCYTEAIGRYIRCNVFVQDREVLTEQLRLSALCRRLRDEKTFSIFYRVLRKKELRYFRLKCVRIGNADDFQRIVFFFSPETEVASHAQMIRALETDEISGAYTKQAFYHRTAELLDKNPEKQFDLIVSDVANFKLINQIYGRKGGDELLKYLGNRYSFAARGGLCARYGADQFVMLSYAMTDEEAERFHALANMLRADAPLPHLIVRYGIYRQVDRADSVAEMCDKAMLAMRSGKRFQDTSIKFYDRDVIQNHFRAQMYEAGFEKAIADREFVVWCQPKYNAFTKRMTSAEALVRWKSAESGFISPGVFIPVFEADGLIVRLDEYVFRYVCSRQKQLLDAGEEPIPISVNLSRATLFRSGTVERYRAMIDEFQLPPRLVPLELTESATVENVQIHELLDGLKAAGFEIHMDDFGSGYSSLSGLSTLELDALKLDKSLIDGIGNKRGDELLRHIIELAHFFQMEVVAEGVEQDSQYRFLKKLSCDTIQGYLFSKPVPFDEFLALRASQPEESSEFMGDALAEEASMGSLRITNDVKLQYLTSLASIYMTMHVIDLAEDTVVEFATTTNVKEHVNRVHNAVGQMQAAMRATVAPEYLQAALKFTNLTTIAARMRGKRTIFEEFMGLHFGRFRARFIAVTTNAREEPETIIFTTHVVEADSHHQTQNARTCRTDELTGVYNLYAYEADVKALNDPTGPGSGKRPDLAVMMADINGLRITNDTLGQAAGDELVWGTAYCLNTVFGKAARIYRIGGDRFAVIFHADEAALEQYRRDFEAAVRSWIGNEARSLSVSFGIAARREEPRFTLEALFRMADRRRVEYKQSRGVGQSSDTRPM